MLASKLCFGQEPSHRVYNFSNGLQTNTVFDVLQVKLGYIWIGTDKGLFKYDGVTFKKYLNANQIGKSLSNIIEIENGEVYCQNFSGQVFYTHKDSLILQKALKPYGNYNLMEKLGDKLYMIANDSLRVLNYKTQKCSSAKPIAGNYANVRISKGKILVHVNADLYEFKNGHFEALGIQLESFNFIKELEVGDVLIARKPSIIQVLKNNTCEKREGLSSKLYINNANVIDQKLWLSTSAGIYVFDKNFKALNRTHPYFQNYRISNLIKDMEGAFWVSTLDNGLLYIPNFEVFKHENYPLSAIAAFDARNILCGTTKNELLSFNLKNATFQHIYAQNVVNELTSIYWDSLNENIITGSNNLSIIKNKQNVYSTDLGVKDIDPMWQYLYAVAYSNGVAIFELNSNKTSHKPRWLAKYYSIKNQRYEISDDNARAISIEFNAKDSIIYYCNAKGLFAFDKGNTREILYLKKPIVASNLKYYNGILYISGYNFGIYTFNENLQKTETLVFSGVNINSANKLKLFNNKLYFVNENGVYQYNIKTNKLLNWNFTDGLPNADIRDILILNNRIYLATIIGLVEFPIETNTVNTIQPNIFLTQILVNGSAKNYMYELELNHDENNINVQFSVPVFKGASLIQCFYKINDNDWEKIAPEIRTISFPNLAPGNYKITIKAVNEDGIECKNNLVLYFNIRPTIYQTWWFALLILVSIVSIILWINKRRINQLKQRQLQELEQQNLKQQLDNSTLKTLRAQMNPHFIYNALNSIQSYVYSGEKELASKYLGLFSDLSRSLLDSSEHTEISLFDELKLIDLYLQLECIRLPKIHYKILKNEMVEEHNIFIPAMVVQPIVENAIKHGLANKQDNCFLEIRLSVENNILIIEIDDNGIGRAKAEINNRSRSNKPQSFSTKAIENRIYILNKNREQKITQMVIDKTDAMGNSLGTLVELTIPINEND